VLRERRLERDPAGVVLYEQRRRADRHVAREREQAEPAGPAGQCREPGRELLRHLEDRRDDAAEG
jgi:hypothetical protein